jgi:hypothetical protein
MPRFQVSVILLLTALIGFLTSFLLLHSGVIWMWLRYPISILVAYGGFLLLLGWWLWLQGRGRQADLSALDYIDELPHPDLDGPHFGGGGDFGGGGAGGNWEDCISSSSVGSEGGSGFLDLGLDAEEIWLLVVAVVALLGGIVATFYVIYIAPALLAEILIDGALVAGLYRRVKRIDERHWLWSAMRRTCVPALLVTLFFTVAAYALQSAVPEAHTMAGVWHHLMQH